MKAPAEPRVRVAGRGDGVVITVEGELDATSADVLVDLVHSAVGTSPATSVEIDVSGADTFTSEGMRALGACAGLGVRVRMGPHVAVRR